jgi:riboflavin synthase alpha subunit
MFTGLVEGIATVVECRPTSRGVRLRVGSPLAGELAPGDSLAVNGVCLTVTLAAASEIHADVGPETMRVTTLGALAPGALVNLERPVRPDGRFGGHFVQGHVDGIGHVEVLRADADFHWLTVSFPSALAPYFVLKGSVAVDGVSLTVARLGVDRFDAMVLPYTLEHTNFKAMKIHDRLNLECDMIGKYVVRAVELAGLSRAPIRAGDVTH